MKKLRILALLMLIPFLYVACNGNNEEQTEQTPDQATAEQIDEQQLIEDYDPNRGLGDFDETNVELGALDNAMAEKGERISQTKCMSCHKLSDERLVGPGWKGVTERQTPHWIMNFITNPDPMLDVDPELQSQLEMCLVRMPNQNLSDTDAREVLEFMRKNDGVK